MSNTNQMTKQQQKDEIRTMICSLIKDEDYLLKQYSYFLDKGDNLTEFQKENIKKDKKILRQKKRFLIYLYNFDKHNMLMAHKETCKRELERLEDYEELLTTDGYTVNTILYDRNEEGERYIDNHSSGEGGYLSFADNMKDACSAREKLIESVTLFMKSNK